MPTIKDTDQPPYRFLRRLLSDHRREVRERLRLLREAATDGAALVRDAEEQGLDDLLRDLELAVVEMKAASLQTIDTAIERLENGHYGTCVDCGAAIPSARLKAVPFAVRCVPCQEAEEAQAALERPIEEALPWS